MNANERQRIFRFNSDLVGSWAPGGAHRHGNECHADTEINLMGKSPLRVQGRFNQELLSGM
jgi:hypothetical protein